MILTTAPLERQLVLTNGLTQRVAKHRIHHHIQHFDAVGALQMLGNRDSGSAAERLVVPNNRGLVDTNSRIVWIYHGKMQRNHTVGTMNRMQKRILTSRTVECQTLPQMRQLGVINGIV